MEPTISYKLTDNSILLEKHQKLFKAIVKKALKWKKKRWSTPGKISSSNPIAFTEILGFFEVYIIFIDLLTLTFLLSSLVCADLHHRNMNSIEDATRSPCTGQKTVKNRKTSYKEISPANTGRKSPT